MQIARAVLNKHFQNLTKKDSKALAQSTAVKAKIKTLSHSFPQPSPQQVNLFHDLTKKESTKIVDSTLRPSVKTEINTKQSVKGSHSPRHHFERGSAN